MDFTHFWDDLETIQTGDYAHLMIDFLFNHQYPAFEEAAENGALFRVAKIEGVMVDLLWQDENGSAITGRFHCTDVDVVVHGNLPPSNPELMDWSARYNPAPLLSLRERTCQAYEDEYTRMQDEALAKWGHMPITFEEYMAEKLDFASQRESARVTQEHWQKTVSERDAEIKLLRAALEQIDFLYQRDYTYSEAAHLVKRLATIAFTALQSTEK